MGRLVSLDAFLSRLLSVLDSCPVDTLWLSCCCGCLPMRSGSITAARSVSRRPAASFQTTSTDQQRRRYVALATLLNRPAVTACPADTFWHFLAELLLLLFVDALRQHHSRSERITKASGKLSNQLHHLLNSKFF